MAKAGRKDTSPELDSALRVGDWTPPGYIEVSALARECGVDEVRNDLFTRRRQAFKLDKVNGGLDPLQPSFWCSEEAERWLKGEFPPDDDIFSRQRQLIQFKVVVQVEDKPTPPVTDGAYLSPFLELMLAAVQYFEIREQHCPKKEVLEEHFRAQRLPDGTPISPNQARYLATFCRPPAAMRGGNTKKG